MITTRTRAMTERGPGIGRAARWVVWGLAVLVCLGVFAPHSAHAYKRKQTRSGLDVFWKNPKVVIQVNESCSADLAKADCLGAVQRALQIWNQPDCSGFKFVFGGTVNRSDVGYDNENPQANVNLVTWVEAGWDRTYSGEDGTSIVALTTRTFDGNSGEMFDADVTFNGQVYQFASLPSGAAQSSKAQDIEGAMIHEAGHILGLDDLYEEKDRGSVMFAMRRLGERRARALSPDDIAGLCAIYPRAEGSTGADASGSDASLSDAMGCTHVTVGGSLEILGALLVLLGARNWLLRFLKAR